MRLVSNILIINIYICQTICQLLSEDPDIYLNASGFIESRGFRSESYDVTTDDGYISTIFRIVNPYLNSTLLKQKPVLLWHGISDSAETWLKNRKGFLNSNGIYSEDNNTVINNCQKKLTSTLAYTLAACGWDVWLGNTRGNQYANRNDHISSDDPKFWDYTLTEMALYDIPATVHKIREITQKNVLSYIGHSLGTTQLFILLSMRPDFQQYIKPFIALAPIVFMGNIRSIYRLIAPIEPYVREITVGIGLPIPVAEFIGKFICGNFLLRNFCVEFNALFYGNDLLNTDFSRLAAMFGNAFDTTSSRVLLHYAQLILTDRFAQFDYNVFDNKAKYGRRYPPDYPLSNITSKDIYLINGSNDILADVYDVRRLANAIKNNVKSFRTISWILWNHLDFILAKYENRYQDFYILQVLRSYDNMT